MRAIVIGAGIGGLSAALRLQSLGYQVTLLDSHAWPGGKMRQLPSAVGPIDAGPTVLTMRHVFDDLFDAANAKLDDHVELVREPLLARHFWSDGSSLDLTDNHDANAKAISTFAGSDAAKGYLRFTKEAASLYKIFRAPMMECADPNILRLAQSVLTNPQHLPTLMPHATLRKSLQKHFSDARLVQLFGRYATYVGGNPLASPAILSLIWQAEASGVWRVKGGMHGLAQAIVSLFQAMGGTLRLQTHVLEILASKERVEGVKIQSGETLRSDLVLFAGDPRALNTGLLGTAVESAGSETRKARRSLSARVWSFAARVTSNPQLAHHNVFFGRNPTAEFEDLEGGAMPDDPTIYLCAEDRGTGQQPSAQQERFEIILNAAPLTRAAPPTDEVSRCHQTTFHTLERFGVSFDPLPDQSALATPTTFEQLFPGSAGSLYGQTPHGMTAALKRPRARTKIRGLFLAGGGAHPGAGVPMAALSGKHAVEAIVKDQVLT